MNTKLLEMKSICKSFSGTQVLFDVDFDLDYGEVHVLAGENGAGKSTLIKILAGIHKPNKGEIFLDGKRIEINGPKDAFDKGISTIHQEFNLVEELDVGSNIFLGREPKTIRGIVDNKRIYADTQTLLNRISATIQPNDLVKNLSVAEKQMVEICKALSFKSKILIMDEPTAVLSQREIDKLFEIIRSMQKQGIAVIYISHRLEELPLIGQLQKDEIGKRRITTMMIGRELKYQFPQVDKKISNVVLEVKHLSEEGVLTDVNFSVRKGEILGFSGLVGSGRTEIVRAIMGIDKISEGDIFLEGKQIHISSPSEAKKMGIVMVPEERKLQGLVLSMSIEDNIMLPYYFKFCKNGVLNKKKMDGKTENIVQEFEIKPKDIETKTENMSGGNQQKVVIAKWSFQPQKIIILDEPTRGVDVGAKAEIYSIMQHLAKQGVAIIMISSDLPEILGISDRIIVMKEGHISGEITDHSKFTEEEVMQLAF